MIGTNTTTIDGGQVGVVEVTPAHLTGSTTEILLRLSEMSYRGRLVGWGVWEQMNRALWGLKADEWRFISMGAWAHWSNDHGTFAAHVDKGTRWAFVVNGHAFTVWDLWEFAKRRPAQGETARGLYGSVGRVGRLFGVKPRHYYSVSALASPILHSEDIEAHLPEAEELGVPHLARWSLFSGRMQVLRIGISDQPCREYDLNSAYGWGLSRLPSLRRAEFDQDTVGLRGAEWALYHVEWDIPKSRGGRPGTPIYPFPVRCRDGVQPIEYPRQGEGWYWTPIVNEAFRHWGQHIRIKDRLLLRTQSPIKPFAFVHGLYERRRELKRGSQEDTIAKWTISTLWGKLCQQPKAEWRHRTRSLLWAGMATSVVNAELLRVAMLDPRRLVHIHVDSLLMAGDRRHADFLGDELGQWRSKGYMGFQQYRVGVWRGQRSDGTWHEKSQGIPGGLFPWDEAEGEWWTFGSMGRVRITLDEFRGLGAAQGREEWLTVKERKIEVPLRPGKMKEVNVGNKKRPGTKLEIWYPPDKVEEPQPWNEEADEFGLDHQPQRSQERFR